MDLITAANARYRNLSDSDFAIFHGLIEGRQSQTLDAALQIFGSDWIDAEHLADLRRSVSRGYWFTRLPYFFSPAADSKLNELFLETKAQFELNRSYLGPEEKRLLSSYLDQLQALESSALPWKELSHQLEALGKNLLVVTEQSRWSQDLGSFVKESGNSLSWTSVAAIGYLAKIQPRDFDALVFLGSPMELSDGHARLLFSSGLAPKTHCWVPGRTTFSGSSLEAKVFGGLRPTLQLPSFKQEKFSDHSLELDDELEEASRRVAIGTASREIDLERLGSGGNQKCLLLRIDDSSVIPVEVDAARVSTLILDPIDGQIKEEPAEWPFAGPGSVVFALIGQGEQDFLWEAAKVQMGREFFEFEAARNEWLELLREFASLHGHVMAEQTLRAGGVTTAAHLGSWLANGKFTRPSADEDFRALLQILVGTEDTINTIMGLTSKFRGQLIQIAKAARKLVCEALDSENWADLQAGENLDVLLEEFGDVVYRVGKVIEISAEVALVPSSQLRRVVIG